VSDVRGQASLEYDANMDLIGGSLSDRLLAVENHIKLVKQRAPFRASKMDDTRLAMLEETQLNFALMLEVLLKAQQGR